MPKDEFVFQVAKPGYAPTFFIDGYGLEWGLKLRPEGSVPPEMVIVAGGEARLTGSNGVGPTVVIDDYLIDRHEVTNEEYKKFVDAGGYQKRDFWKEPFVRDGREIPWEEAVALFVDATGRPGPSTWEAGSHPKGLGKHPVAE